jgi:hypothetical protein
MTPDEHAAKAEELLDYAEGTFASNSLMAQYLLIQAQVHATLSLRATLSPPAAPVASWSPPTEGSRSPLPPIPAAPPVLPNDPRSPTYRATPGGRPAPRPSEWDSAAPDDSQ